MGRQLAEKLSARWDSPILIDNRPGSATITGTVLVAGAAADGYTRLLTNSAFSVNPLLFANLPYDSQKN